MSEGTHKTLIEWAEAEGVKPAWSVTRVDPFEGEYAEVAFRREDVARYDAYLREWRSERGIPTPISPYAMALSSFERVLRDLK